MAEETTGGVSAGESEPGVQEIREFENVYSPGTLLGVYAAALRSPAEGRIVLARGIYQATPGGRVYGDFFYDSIKSVYENRSVKARIPALLRNRLEHGQVYLFKGYVEKKVAFSAIELVLVVDEVLRREESAVSDEDVKRFRLIQQKITRGYRDFESLVKEHIYRSEPLRIVNIYGNNAIVNKDFEKGLGDAATRFALTEHRCNFASRAELIQTINGFSGAGVHAVALVRGGGDPSALELFNDPGVAEACLKVQPLFVTALGHTVNETLCDKLADKKFALPHDYGNTLRVWVEQAMEEQARSKSAFIDQVRTDLQKTFADQIKTLQTQLDQRNKEFAASEEKHKALMEQSQKERSETLKSKEASFTAQLASLDAQLKLREQSAAQLEKRMELTEKEKSELQKKVSATKTTREVVLWVVLAAAAGLITGLLLR